jgi:hypothetical protein
VPAHRHGTTLSHPKVNQMGVAHSWSVHIIEAFEHANAALNKDDGSLVEVSWIDHM